MNASANQSPGDEFHFLLEASRRSNASSTQLFLKDFEAFPGELAASSLISRAMNGQGNAPSSLYDNKFQDLVKRLCLWRDIMARVHDEALRFVLSDAAIISLAAAVPSTGTDILSTIVKVKLDDSMCFIPAQSPSPVISSHLDDLLYLLQGDTVNLDHIFELCLRQRLSPAGSCPLSLYNRAFLSSASLGLSNRPISISNGFRTSKLVAKKNSRELFVQKFSCKSPVYHNCKIYANDGRLLCYCDRRKLEWYINRKLAKLVEDDPPAIMLLFEPKGQPEDEDNVFYIQSKKNICVSCGEGNHYLRYRIIPSCYRVHFPEHLKSHRSHDIVLLCVDCHEIAHAAAEKYKRVIAAEFGIPLFIHKVAHDDDQTISGVSIPKDPEKVGVSPLQLRTAAMALLRHGPQMPSDRREELVKIVRAYYGGREISEVDIERAMIAGMSSNERRKFEKRSGFAFKHLSLPQNGVELKETSDENTADVNETVLNDPRETTQSPCSNKNRNRTLVTDTDDIASDSSSSLKQQSLLGHGPHGEKMVMYLLKEYGEDGIREFCQRWRQIFVKALRPRHLPACWDVMHRGKREFGDFSVYNPMSKSPTI